MFKKFVLVIEMILSLLVINLTSVSADNLILKSGEKIEGKIIEKTEQYIKMEIEGIPLTFWVDEIERVEELPLPAATLIESSLGDSVIEKYLSETTQYYLDGKYEDALLTLKKAIELDPNEFYLYIALGILYYYTDHFEAATSSFQRALSLQPHSADTYMCLGIAYYSIGQIEEAKEALSKSIELFQEKAEMTEIFILESLLKKISKD